MWKSLQTFRLHYASTDICFPLLYFSTQVDREMPTVGSVHFMSPWSGFNLFSPIDSNVPWRGSTLFTRNLNVLCLNVCFYKHRKFLLNPYVFSMYYSTSYPMCSCIDLFKGSQSLDVMDMFITYFIFIDILKQCSENRIHHAWYSVFSSVSCAGITFHCIFIGSFVLSIYNNFTCSSPSQASQFPFRIYVS